MSKINEAIEYERIVWIHNCLKADNLSFDEYSHKFGKSDRTFYRDIDKLTTFFHAPIQKKDGNYCYEDKTYELPHMFVSQKDLSALFAALGILEKYKDTPIYSSTKKIVQKLSESAEKKPTGFKLGNLKKKEIELDWDTFDRIANAIITQNTITINYHSFSSNLKSERKVDPYHLYSYEEEMYLAGYCHKNKAIRDFNLNRIFSVDITSQKYKSEFNKENYFADKNWGIIKDAEVKKIKLKVKKYAVEKVTEDFPSRFKKVGEETDWVVFELETTVTDEFLNWVLNFRGEVVIAKPEEVRIEMKDLVEKILGNYGE